MDTDVFEPSVPSVQPASPMPPIPSAPPPPVETHTAPPSIIDPGVVGAVAAQDRMLGAMLLVVGVVGGWIAQGVRKRKNKR